MHPAGVGPAGGDARRRRGLARPDRAQAAARGGTSPASNKPCGPWDELSFKPYLYYVRVLCVGRVRHGTRGLLCMSADFRRRQTHPRLQTHPMSQAAHTPCVPGCKPARDPPMQAAILRDPMCAGCNPVCSGGTSQGCTRRSCAPPPLAPTSGKRRSSRHASRCSWTRRSYLCPNEHTRGPTI